MSNYFGINNDMKTKEYYGVTNKVFLIGWK